MPSLFDVILVSNARRYADTLNVLWSISDFHNIIGAATKRFAPSHEPYITGVIRISTSLNF